VEHDADGPTQRIHDGSRHGRLAVATLVFGQKPSRPSGTRPPPTRRHRPPRKAAVPAELVGDWFWGTVSPTRYWTGTPATSSATGTAARSPTCSPPTAPTSGTSTWRRGSAARCPASSRQRGHGRVHRDTFTLSRPRALPVHRGPVQKESGRCAATSWAARARLHLPDRLEGGTARRP
jgi:hypothetical protein